MKKVLTIRQEKKRPLKVNLTTSDTYAEEPARGPRTRNTESVIDGTKMTIKQKEMVPLRVLADDLIRTEDIVNTLDSDATDKPLSAAMGKVLREGVDALSPTAMDGYANKSDLEDLQESASAALEDKASIDGYYSTLTVGGAENLIGRGSVSAEFTRRTSGGGTDIGDGAATIATIKGNTLVWNQQAKAFTSTDYSGVAVSDLTFSNGECSFTPNNSGLSSYVQTIGQPFNNISGHKYYIAFTGKKDTAGNIRLRLCGGYLDRITAVTTSYARYSYILTSASSGGSSNWIVGDTAGVKVYIKDLVFIDLTQMGLASLTAAEFEALFPLNYYAYNTGSLLNLTATGLQTNGFNQWDEEWEEGKYNTTTGQPQSGTNQIRSKNYIPIFGGVQYYMNSASSVWACIYDANQQLILTPTVIGSNGNSGNAVSLRNAFTPPADAAYVRFFTQTSYGATYKNDICINLSDINKNGTYEPYWTETKALPITTATSGGVAIFSDGMKSAGTAHDRFYKSAGSDLFDKGRVVIDALNLGTLTGWTYNSGNQYFSKSNANIKLPADWATVANIKCATYYPVTGNKIANGTTDNMLIAYAPNGTILIKNTAYTTSEQLEAALAGVTLYFESRTVTEYTLDTPFNGQYKVGNDGTETLLPENTSTPTTSPIIATVRYPFDAAGTINHLPKNYTSKPTMDNILTAFKTAGLISGFTLEYNEGHENYDCDIE